MNDKLNELLKGSNSWTLTYNDHNSCYDSIEHYYKGGLDEWTSDKDRENAIATGTCYHLQVYPDTPVGFYVVLSDSIEHLIDWLSD